MLNISFDEEARIFLDTDHAIGIITSAYDPSQSQLFRKNCKAFLWTLNRIPHRRK